MNWTEYKKRSNSLYEEKETPKDEHFTFGQLAAEGFPKKYLPKLKEETSKNEDMNTVLRSSMTHRNWDMKAVLERLSQAAGNISKKVIEDVNIPGTPGTTQPIDRGLTQPIKVTSGAEDPPSGNTVDNKAYNPNDINSKSSFPDIINRAKGLLGVNGVFPVDNYPGNPGAHKSYIVNPGANNPNDASTRSSVVNSGANNPNKVY